VPAGALPAATAAGAAAAAAGAEDAAAAAPAAAAAAAAGRPRLPGLLKAACVLLDCAPREATREGATLGEADVALLPVRPGAGPPPRGRMPLAALLAGDAHTPAAWDAWVRSALPGATQGNPLAALEGFL
jgi:hypothetical protein